MSRRKKWVVGTLAGWCLLVITLIVLPVLVEKPLRGTVEREFNA